MTREELIRNLRDLFDNIIKTAEAKNKDYAMNNNAFANFEIVGNMLQMANEDIKDGKYLCWLVYFTKHYISVLNYLRTRESHTEPIEGRIVDMIVYLGILYNMLKEDRRGNDE